MNTVASGTLAHQIEATRGRSSGFDYMRILLAIMIVAFHTTITSYGIRGDYVWWFTPARPFIRMLLPMFFALSGFLVAGSLERTKTLLSFLGLRVIRIYPALAVESLISAFILGAAVTTLPLEQYFTNKGFYIYLLNIIGDVQFHLPGVFLQNPLPDKVNGQLWTVPFELLSYISLALLTLLGLRRWRVLAPAGVAITTIGTIAEKLIRHPSGFPPSVTSVRGPLLVASFLAGVTLFLYRERLPWSRIYLLVSAIVSIILLWIVPYGEYAVPIFAAYTTVYLGLTNPPRVRILKSADYSYGLFLYSFAIQQWFSATFLWGRHWYWNLLICLPLSLAIAAVSWTFIEKPALKLRKHLDTLDRWFAKRSSALGFAPPPTEEAELAKRPLND